MRTFWLMMYRVWALPTSAVGLVLGAVNTIFGGRWQVRRGVLENYGGVIARVMDGLPWTKGSMFLAITFGDVILGRSAAALDMARDHEHVHVRQTHVWGPLFLPAYVLASAWVWYRGGDAYRDNPFEVEAYGVSGGEE